MTADIQIRCMCLLLNAAIAALPMLHRPRLAGRARVCLGSCISRLTWVAFVWSYRFRIGTLRTVRLLRPTGAEIRQVLMMLLGRVRVVVALRLNRNRITLMFLSNLLCCVPRPVLAGLVS